MRVEVSPKRKGGAAMNRFSLDSAGSQIPSEPRPDDRNIAGQPIAQTILAIAFLIAVTLLSFLGVAFIGRLLGNNQATYWLIELIFGILCAGAGALVGGSADVRSTLNIPGSPAQARLGGAVAMVIVGFALAYLARPAEPAEHTYALQIQNVPHSQDVDNIRYNITVAAIDDDVTITTKSNVVEITIPTHIQTYGARLVVFRSDRDSPRIFARCPLTLENSNRPELRTKQIAPDAVFRVYLAHDYIAKVVHEAITEGHAIESEPCVEAFMRNGQDQRKLLNGYFTLGPVDTISWLLNVAHIAGEPPYAITASPVEEDVPPTALPGGGVTSQQPVAPAAGGSAAHTPQAPRSDHSSTPAAASVPSTAVPDQLHRANDQNNSAYPNVTGGLPEMSQDVRSIASVLDAQVDAYIQGQNLDRTQLYQNWDQVAGYVVDGFRKAVTYNSPAAERYVQLIANAMNAIDDGKYMAPTLRPNWDRSTKSNRLRPDNQIPGFGTEDYEKIVSLLCSADPAARNASQRLLRVFPSDNFHQPINALKARSNECDAIFLAESAAYYFYNRLVEYVGKFPLDEESVRWLHDNFIDGDNWVKVAVSKDPSQDVFRAMLDYGYGITLWERGPNDPKSQDSGLAHFETMLKTLGSSKGIYPSSPFHIATALRETSDPSAANAASATRYNASSLHPANGNYITHETRITLFSSPDVTSKKIGSVNNNETVRIYLRSENWDMVQAGAKFGWAQRTVKSVKN
jgi:hypothetical protein